jgi:hypothetical protein
MGLGPKTLCCGKPYTGCECKVAELSDEVFELPPPIVIVKQMPKQVPHLYPGSPAAWRSIRWGGFNIYAGDY